MPVHGQAERATRRLGQGVLRAEAASPWRSGRESRARRASTDGTTRWGSSASLACRAPLRSTFRARSRLSYPHQGRTSDVAFAEHEGRVVVVKRCAHPVYLDWLRREHVALRALAGSGLPVPNIHRLRRERDRWRSRGLARRDPPCRAGRSSAALMDAAEPKARGVAAVARRARAATACDTRSDRARQGEGLDLAELAQARANLSWCDGTPAGFARARTVTTAPRAADG